MGKLIVIEGLDGTGKETQSKLLYEKLISKGYQVMKISYPRYDNESSSLVKMYLRGDFGTNPDNISPYISSTFYAADRYASYKTEIESFYKNGGIVIADRYTTSNMVHQGGKINSQKELDEYLNWLTQLEFEIYKIPIPDKVFLLDLPLEFIVKRIEERENKITKDSTKDIHENSIEHLRRAYDNAIQLADKYHWEKINCVDESGIRGIDEINKQIFNNILNIL